MSQENISHNMIILKAVIRGIINEIYSATDYQKEIDQK